MKRSPMKRGDKPLARGKGLRKRSRKMAAKYAGEDGRRALVARLLRERPYCEAGAPIVAALMGMDPSLARHLQPRGDRLCAFKPGRAQAIHCCDGASVDLHEVIPRSGGGSILDETNIKTTCRLCHGWISDFPREAMSIGLLASRHGPERTLALAAQADWRR